MIARILALTNYHIGLLSVVYGQSIRYTRRVGVCLMILKYLQCSVFRDLEAIKVVGDTSIIGYTDVCSQYDLNTGC